MKTIFLLLTWGLTAFAAPKLAWIVGDEYVALTDFKKILHSVPARPTSHAFDAERCAVWTNGEKGLWLHTTEGKKSAPQPTGTLLSSVDERGFLARGVDGALEARDRDGNLVKSEPAPWLAHAEEIARGKDNAYVLHVDEEKNKLWVTQYPSLKQTVLENQVDIWGYRRIHLDEKNGRVWVGFTHTTPSHIYAPAVRQLDLQGEIKAKYEWSQKGLFFDSCLDTDGKLLVSRDLPSDSGFTVPLYSFLDRVEAGGAKTVYYSGDVNLFMDSIVCRPEAVHYIERSIFGSDGSWLARWDRDPQKLGESIFKLPGKAQRLYVCE